MNNSSLLENTDFENERIEIPPETMIPHKANQLSVFIVENCIRVVE